MRAHTKHRYLMMNFNRKQMDQLPEAATITENSP